MISSWFENFSKLIDLKNLFSKLQRIEQIAIAHVKPKGEKYPVIYANWDLYLNS